MEDSGGEPQSKTDRASAAIGRMRSGGKSLVARASESYQTWSTTASVEAVPPSDIYFPASTEFDAQVVAVLKENDPLAASVPSVVMAGLAIDPDAVVLSKYLLAGSIAEQTEYTDRSRYNRMQRYYSNQRYSISEACGVYEFSPSAVLAGLTTDWTASQKLLLLIETASGNPFAPYQIAWDPNLELAGLAYVAEVLGMSPDAAIEVAATFSKAAQAHKRISLARASVYGIGAAAALGSAGFLAAPAVGAALGSAAGLSGAAATSYGLGLLGSVGGATAPGTVMSGGMWLVAQAGATAGVVAGAGGSLLYGMGANQAQNEIIKLQVTYKMILVDLQKNDAAAFDVLTEMQDRLSDVEWALQEELDFSDEDSERVVNMEANAETLRSAVSWMDELLVIEDDGGLYLHVKEADARIARVEAALQKRKSAAVAARDESVSELLPAKARQTISDRIDCRFAVSAELDRWDVVAAVAAGIGAALIDAIIIGDPSNPLTSRLRSDVAIRGGNWLEGFAKVPYDPSIAPGMTPSNHRVLTPGHDPLLGLVIGTRDILQSTMTRSDIHGAMQFVDRPTVAGSETILTALMTQVAHLFSDIVTPAGLPLPAWSLMTAVPGYAETAVKMYAKGYDTWHLAPMTVPVAAVHATTSAYWAMRSDETVTQDRKDAVSLLAFGIASIGDLASMLAIDGNPLTLNYSLWVTLARRMAKQVRRRSYRSALVTMDDATRNQHLLNHGWSVLLGESASR